MPSRVIVRIEILGRSRDSGSAFGVSERRPKTRIWRGDLGPFGVQYRTVSCQIKLALIHTQLHMKAATMWKADAFRSHSWKSVELCPV